MSTWPKFQRENRLHRKLKNSCSKRNEPNKKKGSSNRKKEKEYKNKPELRKKKICASWRKH